MGRAAISTSLLAGWYDGVKYESWRLMRIRRRRGSADGERKWRVPMLYNSSMLNNHLLS